MRMPLGKSLAAVVVAWCGGTGVGVLCAHVATDLPSPAAGLAAALGALLSGAAFGFLLFRLIQKGRL